MQIKTDDSHPASPRSSASCRDATGELIKKNTKLHRRTYSFFLLAKQTFLQAETVRKVLHLFDVLHQLFRRKLAEIYHKQIQLNQTKTTILRYLSSTKTRGP